MDGASLAAGSLVVAGTIVLFAATESIEASLMRLLTLLVWALSFITGATWIGPTSKELATMIPERGLVGCAAIATTTPMSSTF